MLDAVRELISDRKRFPEIMPREIVGLIQAKRAESGFPNLAQWANCSNWLEAHATTSAERCVQTAGANLVPNPIGTVPEVTPEMANILGTLRA